MDEERIKEIIEAVDNVVDMDVPCEYQMAYVCGICNCDPEDVETAIYYKNEIYP